MADALENIAVFDRLNGVPAEPDVESACAFVAGESLSLLAAVSPPLVEVEEPVEEDAIQISTSYVAIEAALLYMIGGYEVNALALVRNLPEPIPREVQTLRDARLSNADYLLERLRDLCSGNVLPVTQGPPFRGYDTPPPLYRNLVDEVRIWIYLELSVAISDFLNWLGGYADDGLIVARRRIGRIRRATAPPNHANYAEFADMHHLASLLAAMFERTGQRSLVQVLPPATTNDPTFALQFQTYRLARARGDAATLGRPFLWPSAYEFMQMCLPGPKCDAVIAMPTGSGKSFVAELAVADALSRGNVIYLAPTNALVHQVRRDLARSLAPFEAVQVLAFVGSGEYTRLGEEELTGKQGRFVAVMTPEKCALALRLTPEAFEDCALCVFDECHLLNDEHRGVTADLLLAQLFRVAPKMLFVLMSAMIANPEELADWLHTARGSEAHASVTKWRPSRTLRGLLVVDREPTAAAFEAAKNELEIRRTTNKKRKNVKFDAELALIAGLSGPWTFDGPADYRIANLGLQTGACATFEEVQKKIISTYQSWKNPASRLLAERLAGSGLPTINFILSSRHHAFSSASAVTTTIPNAIGDAGGFPAIVEAWLSLADCELGQPTALRNLLRRGIAVHTSAMLQVEQAAAEWMFSHGLALLMFATGTLAQGLNLPAVAVVVAGTSMGDPREAKEADKIAGLGQRVDATILNGFGRAGRPSFSNQGLAVLVSDGPFAAPVTNQLDPALALQRYKVLGQPDAAVEVGSPIERFLDRVFVDVENFQAATVLELELTTQLAESPLDQDHAGQILRRTFGGYRRRQVFDDAMSLRVRDRIDGLKQAILDQPNIPPWLNSAAMKSGVDLFRAWAIWSAYGERGIIGPEAAVALNVMDWLALFIDVMGRLHPTRVADYMADDEVKTASVLTRLRDSAAPWRGLNSVPWKAPVEWPGLWMEIQGLVAAYMNGTSYTVLAKSFSGIAVIPPDRIQAKPLPAIFSLIRKVMEPLARDAGCLVALIEQAWKAEVGAEVALPEALQALPLCLRAGCNSLSTLAWFRFGFRQRVSAHALAAAFPPPSDLANDSDRARWVRDTRKKWLRGMIEPVGDSTIATYAKTILLNAND